MIIDAHTHLGPSLREQGESFGPVYEAYDGRSLVSVMDRAGIAKACVFAPFWEGGDFIDPDFKIANRAILDAVSQYPDRLIGYGRVDPNFGAEAMEELHRCIEEYRFQGLKLHPDTEGFVANDIELLGPILEVCERQHWPVFFHSGYYPTCQPALFLPLAEAFPRVDMILAHVGYRHMADAVIVAQRASNLYLETSGNSTAATIRTAIKEIGADRFLYGSDLPYHIPEYVLMKITQLEDVTEEEKALVLGGNMARLLGLEWSPAPTGEAGRVP